ncbi:DUF499 domain-containing protein [Tomitella cavernea]|uniref:DUF499 domain-containing protein n=1 Tax=Tomitella cavernea TaxID=1387982 RepID=UPI0019057C23|nr:DUF499 domain-containing protein [Tomitella cavernea]
MALSNRDRVGRAFEQLAEGLDQFLTRVFAGEITGDADWTALLQLRDKQGGISGKTYQRTDPQCSLKIIATNVTGQIKKGWFPLNDFLSRAQMSLASELMDTRNKWAHNGSFSGDDAYRALDTMERLLTAAGQPDQAGEVRKWRVEIMRISADQADRKVVSSGTAEVGASGVTPWREVLRPHEDVASGNFHAAEFAADLAMVSRGDGDPEYTDPVPFFQRTYLTEGLRDLIVRAVRRLGGDDNASPVINLQTNFGGGKTHSMLAVWHLASGTPVIDYPQDVQDVLAGLSLPGSVRRVALVGTQIQAGAVKPMPDGTRVHTIWGLLAWHLGGAEGYAIVEESDRAGTNPGEALRTLFERFGPAVILIDEWVAYARMLHGRDDLVDGSFDAQFTFAQTLTEAAKAVSGVLVLISIPASAEMKDGEYVGDEEEVGGENGRAALRMLRNAIGRVADQWRAAGAEEAFEIVRRRLFETPDAQALAQIGATARAMVEFYRKNSDDFPREVRENDYEERIRRSYPVHPELFDRLYQDWSTLERFQRTRGVLRLMNTIVGQLWRDNDSAPLIMPGSVPLRADAVLTELTQYLGDEWKALIDTDVDGEHAAPARVDAANKALGQRLVTQRLARTVFMGAAPTLTSAHKGIDQQRVFLGTALPGDQPGSFHSALNRLANTATYFYSSGAMYWYDTQANTTRTARDYAERLHPEDVWAEVTARLEKHRKVSADGFAAVHVAPENTADIPDAPEVRLVIVPPAHTHSKTASTAKDWALDATEHRGSAARQCRNMIAFLAADDARYGELSEVVREYLAWSYVHDNADKELNLTAAQREQARERREKLDTTVDARLLETYIHVLYPVQPVANRPLTMESEKDTTGQNLVDRAAARMRNQSALATQRSGNLVRMDIDRYLRGDWDRDGHIDSGTLWSYYTRYPYMPRLRDRTVLEAGVLDALDQLLPLTDGFAVAQEWDGARYVGLVLPGDPTPPQVTDALLVVEPGRAENQRAQEIIKRDKERERIDGGAGDNDGTDDGRGVESGHGGGTGADGQSGGRGANATIPPGPRPKTRFFGSATLGQLYGKDFSTITDEVIQNLAAVDGVHLEVRLEITATAPGGFDESTVRTVGENANTLKFDQSGFEED